jgi:hypothetical protein
MRRRYLSPDVRNKEHINLRYDKRIPHPQFFRTAVTLGTLLAVLWFASLYVASMDRPHTWMKSLFTRRDDAPQTLNVADIYGDVTSASAAGNVRGGGSGCNHNFHWIY